MFSIISRAKASVFLWSTFCLYLAHVVQIGALMTSLGGAPLGFFRVCKHASVACFTLSSASNPTRMESHWLSSS